eukprot:TRINITY_DN3685_c0_g1_i2.p1 TRINITY_DN3685_c0_g1~~TRINITY_DN3685_c0_g1_i2.p1  ORF type:complete len:449 (+),score=146.18 TRINITY_DN3685_c0_g1_i2:46-1347(+)
MLRSLVGSEMCIRDSCIAYHRAAIYGSPGEIEAQAAQDGASDQLMKKEALMMHTYNVPIGYTWSKMGRAAVLVATAITFALVLVGSLIDVYSFEFEGATHFLKTRKLSLWSTATEISKTDDGFGIRMIQITFLLFGMIIPLMHLLSLAVLWLMPLTLHRQHILFVTTEVLNAWSALEVFVVSIIVALLELPTFAQFIIGDMCDIPNHMIKVMDHWDPPVNIGHGEDKCFDVKANLESGCWVLFGAFALAILIIQLITRSCAQAKDERLFAITHRVARDSTMSHIDPEALRESFEIEEDETCTQGCNRRNRECNHKVNVGFFNGLARVGMVELVPDDKRKKDDDAEDGTGEPQGQYASYEEYARKQSSQDSSEEPVAVQTHSTESEYDPETEPAEQMPASSVMTNDTGLMGTPRSQVDDLESAAFAATSGSFNS